MKGMIEVALPEKDWIDIQEVILDRARTEWGIEAPRLQKEIDAAIYRHRVHSFGEPFRSDIMDGDGITGKQLAAIIGVGHIRMMLELNSLGETCILECPMPKKVVLKVLELHGLTYEEVFNLRRLRDLEIIFGERSKS